MKKNTNKKTKNMSKYKKEKQTNKKGCVCIKNIICYEKTFRLTLGKKNGEQEDEDDEIDFIGEDEEVDINKSAASISLDDRDENDKNIFLNLFKTQCISYIFISLMK